MKSCKECKHFSISNYITIDDEVILVCCCERVNGGYYLENLSVCNMFKDVKE